MSRLLVQPLPRFLLARASCPGPWQQALSAVPLRGIGSLAAAFGAGVLAGAFAGDTAVLVTFAGAFAVVTASAVSAAFADLAFAFEADALDCRLGGRFCGRWCFGRSLRRRHSRFSCLRGCLYSAHHFRSVRYFCGLGRRLRRGYFGRALATFAAFGVVPELLLLAAVLTLPVGLFEAGAAVFAALSDAGCAGARFGAFAGVVSLATLTSQLAFLKPYAVPQNPAHATQQFYLLREVSPAQVFTLT